MDCKAGSNSGGGGGLVVWGTSAGFDTEPCPIHPESRIMAKEREILFLMTAFQ
jgi:hypothetical protein